MKYERRTVDSIIVRLELYDDAMDDLTDQEIGQVMRATRQYVQAKIDKQPFEQPKLSTSAQVAFKLMRRSQDYTIQSYLKNCFNSKFNKDFGDILQKGVKERIDPELVAKQLSDEQLAERGYTEEEIAMIHTRIEDYEAKQRAKENKPAPKKGKVVTEQVYDQRQNTEPDGESVPEWLKERMKEKTM